MQNQYNLAHRGDDCFIDELAGQGVAYTPFFPLGEFTPLQSSTLENAAASVKATPMQVALAWLLRRSPNILLFPGTSSVDHLRENLKAGDLLLPPKTVADLNGIAAEAEPKRSAPSVILRNTPLNGCEQKRLSNIYSSAFAPLR